VYIHEMKVSSHGAGALAPPRQEKAAPHRHDRSYGRWLALGFGMILAAFLTEAGARVWLWSVRGDSTIGLPERTRYLHYRPFVMFGPDWDAILGKLRRQADDGRYRVLPIGASTAEAFAPRCSNRSVGGDSLERRSRSAMQHMAPTKPVRSLCWLRCGARSYGPT
jgi:hypothetical protein